MRLESWAKCDQVTTVNRARLVGRPLGHLDETGCMKLQPLCAWRWNYERRVSSWPKVLAGWLTCVPVTHYPLLSLSKGGREPAFVRIVNVGEQTWFPEVDSG